jgi:hypothetical protein
MTLISVFMFVPVSFSGSCLKGKRRKSGEPSLLWVNRLLGVVGALVVTRVMGLLLAAIAVNFVAVGIGNIYRSIV